MNAEKIADLVHMVELMHRQPDFYQTLEEHKLDVADWYKMIAVFQDFYEKARAGEGTLKKHVSIGNISLDLTGKSGLALTCHGDSREKK